VNNRNFAEKNPAGVQSAGFFISADVFMSSSEDIEVASIPVGDL